jgi:hypothetical protein|tara:strand:- start:625 stop:795 length:171 start_codon:yes stop_codon:yes gene_type:complete
MNHRNVVTVPSFYLLKVTRASHDLAELGPTITNKADPTPPLKAGRLSKKRLLLITL